MKQCPACKTTYTDETLRFCLADGATLNHAEQETVVRQVFPKAQQTAVQAAPATFEQKSGSDGIFKVLLVLIGLGILGLLVVSVGGVFYFNMSKGEAPVNKDVKVAISPTPTKDDNDDELRDQIADLQKQLNDQKKTGQPANMPAKMPNQSSTTTTARVNSPGDGFLALRSLPNSEAGERILKIPHGATVSVGACGPVITPGKRSGRWCQASYDGYSGYVFDAYLIY